MNELFGITFAFVLFFLLQKLSRVGFDMCGMKYLKEGLKTNKTLTHLDLSGEIIVNVGNKYERNLTTKFHILVLN